MRMGSAESRLGMGSTLSSSRQAPRSQRTILLHGRYLAGGSTLWRSPTDPMADTVPCQPSPARAKQPTYCLRCPISSGACDAACPLPDDSRQFHTDLSASQAPVDSPRVLGRYPKPRVAPSHLPPDPDWSIAQGGEKNCIGLPFHTKPPRNL